MSHRSDNRSHSSFVFGLILGLIVGAIAAILIYRNRRSEVFKLLKKKIQEIFEPFLDTEENIVNEVKKTEKKIVKTAKKISKPIKKAAVTAVKDLAVVSKKPVIIPENIPVLDLTPPKASSKPKTKTFVKPKK